MRSGLWLVLLGALGCGQGTSSNMDSSTSAGADMARPGPPPGAKRVFITSDSFPFGDLVTLGGDHNGVISGDKLCAIAASRAGLDGTWRAWLSQSGADAIDRITDAGPWYRLDGALVFADRGGLKSEALVPIDRAEDGSPVACGKSYCCDAGCPDRSTLVALTGSTAGLDSLGSCNDWRGGSAGVGGTPLQSPPGNWSSAWSSGCNLPGLDFRLYCFEI